MGGVGEWEGEEMVTYVELDGSDAVVDSSDGFLCNSRWGVISDLLQGTVKNWLDGWIGE